MVGARPRFGREGSGAPLCRTLQAGHRALKLAELHVHLEGTVSHRTATELAAAHGLPAPPAYEYSTLDGFLAIYREVCHSMQSAADFERVIAEHAASMAAERIAYSEISFNPSLHPGTDWLAGIERGRERAHRDFGVEIAWLVELVRDADAAANEHALDVALATAGVVGLGLVGDESISTAPLEPIVDRARAKGLRFMPHAGQTGGPEVVRDAIENLHADRIAHGVSALGDPSVLALIAERHLCLCVCPTSNARIGLRPEYAKLAQVGLQMTVNSDDPAMVGTSLTAELDLATARYGLERATLISAAWENSFSA